MFAQCEDHTAFTLSTFSQIQEGTRLLQINGVDSLSMLAETVCPHDIITYIFKRVTCSADFFNFCLVTTIASPSTLLFH